MAKLPDAQSAFGALQPLTSRRPIAQYDDTAIAKGSFALGEAIDKGTDKLAAGFESVAKDMRAVAEQEQRLDLAKRDAQFLSEHIDLDSEFSRDTDYKTAEGRYRQRLDEIKTRAVEGASPRSKEVLETRFADNYARGMARIRSQVFSQQGHANIGYVTEQEDKFLRQVPEMDDPEARQRVIRTYHGMVDGLRGRGYITPEATVRMKRDFADRYVVQDAMMLIERDPVEAVRRLEGKRATGTPAGTFSGMTAPGNIDLDARPELKNPDGSISTVKSISVNIDGKEVLLPTISDDGKEISVKDAITIYRKTGKHLGIFATPDDASRYGKALSAQQEKRYASGERDIYGHLRDDQRRQLLSRARSGLVGEQQIIKERIGDDIASILRTGDGVKDLTSDRVELIFGPKGKAVVREWQTAREDASEIWTGSHDLSSLTDVEIRKRVQSYEPAAGAANFERKVRIHDTLQDRAQGLFKQRHEDPAASVDGDENVAKAKAGYSPTDPSSFLPLAKARMRAQERVNIPEDMRSPITKNEAVALLAPLQRILPGQHVAYLKEVMPQFRSMFGDDADVAMQYALRAQRVDAEVARKVAPMIRKLASGEDISAIDARGLDQATDIAAADRAAGANLDAVGFGARALPIPLVGPAATAFGVTRDYLKNRVPEPGATIPKRAIERLRANQQLAPAFDKEYGKGAAKKILETFTGPR